MTPQNNKEIISERERVREALLLERTYAGFKHSSINHELCHYTDDVTHILASNPAGVGSNNIIDRKLTTHIEHRARQCNRSIRINVNHTWYTVAMGPAKAMGMHTCQYQG